MPDWKLWFPMLIYKTCNSHVISGSFRSGRRDYPQAQKWHPPPAWLETRHIELSLWPWCLGRPFFNNNNNKNNNNNNNNNSNSNNNNNKAIMVDCSMVLTRLFGEIRKFVSGWRKIQRSRRVNHFTTNKISKIKSDIANNMYHISFFKYHSANIICHLSDTKNHIS